MSAFDRFMKELNDEKARHDKQMRTIDLHYWMGVLAILTIILGCVFYEM